MILKKLPAFVLVIFLILMSFGCCSHLKTNKPESDLINHMSESTVMLVQETPLGPQTYCGGVWISPQHILTARHCVAGKEEVKIQSYQEFDGKFTFRGKEKTYTSKVLARAKKADLAVLLTEEKIAHHIARIYAHRIPVGLTVHLVSHPSRLGYNYSRGIVSQIRDMDIPIGNGELEFYVIHATISGAKGSSGGPLFSPEGKLLGIGSFLIRTLPTALFFIHRDMIVEFLEEEEIPYF